MLLRFLSFSLLLNFIISASFSQTTIDNWQIYNQGSTAFQINKATSIRVGGAGNIWVGTFDRGVFRLDASTGQWNEYMNPETSGFPGNDISSIRIFQGSQIYVTTGFHGLGKYNGTSWITVNKTNTPQLPHNKVDDVDKEANDHLWIATDQGLAVDSADNANWRIFNTTSTPSLPSNQIIGIKIDQNNTKWVATASNGLASIDAEGNNSSTYNILNSGLPSNTIHNLYIRNNQLYICTNSGLAVFDMNSTWSVYNAANTTVQKNNAGIANNDIRAVTFDYLGRTILATAGGVAIKLTDGWYTLTSQNSNLPENDITDVAYNASTNEIWVATSNSGIAKIHADEITDDLILNNHKALSRLEVKVFPNPANEIINIHFTEPLQSDAVASIMDLQGAIVLQETLTVGSGTTSIDINKLPQGLYILKISLDNNLSTHKIYIR